MSTICKPVVNFVSDGGTRDYCTGPVKDVKVSKNSMRNVFKFLLSVTPGLSIDRAVRCVGYLFAYRCRGRHVGARLRCAPR